MARTMLRAAPMRAFVFGVLCVSALSGAGCLLGSDADDAETSEEPLKDHSSPHWIYEGLLPRLDKPFIHISLSVNTLRVTGYLPDGFDRPLPFYAKKDVKNGRERITVVYPIATGAKVKE